MYVCLCHAVTDHEIRDEVANGPASVEAVMQCTGAGTRCGGCRPAIAALIAQKANSEVPPQRHLPCYALAG